MECYLFSKIMPCQLNGRRRAGSEENQKCFLLKYTAEDLESISV